jgi:ABC-type Fe3+/spermidine/putrescine transport system ATPase subunit
MKAQGGDSLVSFRNVQKTYDGETRSSKILIWRSSAGIRHAARTVGFGQTTCLTPLAGFETPTSGRS